MTDFIYGFVGFIFGLYFFLRLFSEILFRYDPSANRRVHESTPFNKTFHEQRKVPHIIHQIWVGSSLSEECIESSSTWMKFAETFDWEYKLWQEDDLNDIVIRNRGLMYDKVKTIDWFGPFFCCIGLESRLEKKSGGTIERKYRGPLPRSNIKIALHEESLRQPQGKHATCRGEEKKMQYVRQKFRWENVRKAMANFVLLKGAQSKFKCMYCISILLLCQAPIEDREFFSICWLS